MRRSEKATDYLYERDVKIRDESGDRHGGARRAQAVECRDGQWYVELTFTQGVAPYVTLLHQQFTTCSRKQVAQVIGIDEFRMPIEREDKYDRFANLKVRVIEPAIRELMMLQFMVKENPQIALTIEVSRS